MAAQLNLCLQTLIPNIILSTIKRQIRSLYQMAGSFGLGSCGLGLFVISVSNTQSWVTSSPVKGNLKIKREGRQ